MSSAEQDKEREETALDALIVAAFKEDHCEIDEAEIDKLRNEMSSEEQVALDKQLGPSFIDSLFAGSFKRTAKKERGALQTAMNRSDKDVDEPLSEKAQAEMDAKIREEEDRRKAEEKRRQEGQDGG